MKKPAQIPNIEDLSREGLIRLIEAARISRKPTQCASISDRLKEVVIKREQAAIDVLKKKYNLSDQGIRSALQYREDIRGEQ